MTSRTQFIAAVEIGTSKISVLVGEYTDRELAIIGYGDSLSRGVVKGEVVDFKAASEAVHSAMQTAERSAGESIDAVYLAQSGGHMEAFYNEASVNVKAADNMVSAVDIDTVCRLATAKELPTDRVVVHNIRRPFRIDGRRVPGSPEHLVGQRLEVGYWTVHGRESKVASNIHIIRGFSLPVRELILSSLASGHMVTTAEERQNGILAIDIGAGTSDYVLYRDGGAHTTGVAPVGGSHVTNDLTLGLRLTEVNAEKLKLRYGRALVQARSKGDKVWLEGNFAIGDRQFPQQTIEQVTAARMTEVFDVVKRRLGAAFTTESCPAGVVLTGGAAKIPAAAECAAKVFGVPAHLGQAPNWVAENLRDPGFSTTLGLLYYGLASQPERSAPQLKKTGFFQKLFAQT